VLSATFDVTAIMLCYTKNIYKICNCKPHPESKFPNEYIGVILFKSINIWKSYSKNTKGSRFYGTRCRFFRSIFPVYHSSRAWSMFVVEDVIVRPLSTVEYTSIASVFHSRQWSD